MEEFKKVTRKPTIVLPYTEPNSNDNFRDLYIYLRPESNGIRVESLIFGVIHDNFLYRDGISLVYLANLPGDFVSKEKIIERHYSLKCEIAKKGRECFTPLMIERFEKWYKVNWDDVNIVTAYEALRILKVSSKELFNIWVNEKDFFYVHGQSIKKIGQLYVINYDIPELLKMNNLETDIATMVFRTKLCNRELTSLISKIEVALKSGGIIKPNTPPRRCFHYTKSPLEEILDGTGYLYDKESKPIPFTSISFVSYLMRRGLSENKIVQLVKYPIVLVEEKGEYREVYLYDYLLGDSYSEAYEKISKVLFIKEDLT